MDEKQKAAMLKALAEKESSNGYDIEHAPSTKGASPGDTAIGTYGLMPDTIQEMLSRKLDSNLENLKDAPDAEVKDTIEKDIDIPNYLRRSGHASIEDQLAGKLVEHVYNKQQGDIPAALGSWIAGHNTPPEKMQEMLNKPGYVKDYVSKTIPAYNKAMEQTKEDRFKQIMDAITNPVKQGKK